MFGRYAIATLVTFGLLVMGLGLAAGSAGASAVGAAAHASAGTTSNATGTWNVSSGHPVWNSGNLCNATRNGSTIWCTYSGSTSGGYGGHGGRVTSGCGTCTPALSYNFSGDKKTVYIQISNLSSSNNHVYLNAHGNHDTIYLNISGGCSGGVVNMTVLGEHDVVNVNYSASGIVSTFYFYPDHDTFNAVYSGSLDVTATYFSEVGTKKQICPYGNTSKSDSASVMSSGVWDVQYLIWTNGVGYSTSLHWTNMTSSYSGAWGAHSYIGWENTTTAWCGWSIAPPCSSSHHGHWNGIAAGKAPD